MLNTIQKEHSKSFNDENHQEDIHLIIHQILASIDISDNSKIFTSLDNLHSIIHKSSYKKL